MGAEISAVTVADVDAMLSYQVPLLKEGGTQVKSEAMKEIDRLLDLRNQLAIRVLGLAEVELL